MKLTVFGRDPQQADVVLSSTFVSSYHAELIQLDNGDMYLVDKSSNGTLLNGNKLVPGKETPVRRGDNVMFADVPLNWNQVEDVRMPADVKQVKTIGAHYTSNIKLQGAGVSRFHAALRQMKDGKWYICDYSKNGTTLNGQRLPKNTYVPVKAKDEIVCAGVPVSNPIPKKSVGKIIGIVSAAVVACAAIVCAIILPDRVWSPSKIYATYNPSVVYLEAGYHYKLECAGVDLSILPDPKSWNGVRYTKSFPTEFTVVDGEYVRYDKEEGNSIDFSGTGFFVGSNGHIATNLHIARPWLFDDGLASVERSLRSDLSELAIEHKIPLLLTLVPELKVVGCLDYCYAIPNGNYYNIENAYRCSEVIASEDTKVDLAIFRLQKTTLPEGTTYVPFSKISDKKPELGEIVYTSGFPYGRGLQDDLKNKQIQVNSVDGEITKNISDYHFMTTAPIASGASGSPAFNMYGDLVGIMYAGIDAKSNFNFAIYSQHLLDLMKKAKIVE